MVGMGMGTYDQFDIFKSEFQFHQSFLHVVKQVAVARIDEHSGGTVNQIGVAIIGGHGFPDKGVKIVR
jgi:hypothetical protein